MLKRTLFSAVLFLLSSLLISAALNPAVISIDFEQPAGSTITINNKTYSFPVSLKFAQKTNYSYANKGGYDLEMTIPDPERSGVYINLKGKLYVYKTPLTDADILARNEFQISSELLGSAKRGAAITIEGLSASNNRRPLYRTILGLNKTETSVHQIDVTPVAAVAPVVPVTPVTPVIPEIEDEPVTTEQAKKPAVRRK